MYSCSMKTLIIAMVLLVMTAPMSASAMTIQEQIDGIMKQVALLQEMLIKMKADVSKETPKDDEKEVVVEEEPKVVLESQISGYVVTQHSDYTREVVEIARFTFNDKSLIEQFNPTIKGLGQWAKIELKCGNEHCRIIASNLTDAHRENPLNYKITDIKGFDGEVAGVFKIRYGTELH